MSDGIEHWLADLRAKSAEARIVAAQKLATLGEQPAAAVPLVAALDDPDDQVREWATAALESLGPPRVEDVAALVSSLAGRHSLVCYWAATLLGRLGADAAAARDALKKVAAAHADSGVKKRAAWAIARIDAA